MNYANELAANADMGYDSLLDIIQDARKPDRPIIYTSGRMDGLTRKEMTEWRYEAESFLTKQYKFLHPTDRSWPDDPAFTGQLVQADYEDIRDSNILLVRAVEPTWGTAMEMHAGFQQGKLVVTWANLRKNLSPWVRYHSHFLFHGLDAAVYFLEHLRSHPVDQFMAWPAVRRRLDLIPAF